MAEEELAVFGFWPSPYSRRVEIALKLKGVEYKYVEEDAVKNKSDLLLKYNPIYKKVPVLLHHGKPISESVVILEFIDENWSNNYPLFPQDPYDRAQARFWARYIDDKIGPAVMKAGKSKGGEEIEKGLEEAHNVLEPLENELNGKKYFGGDKISFLDIVGLVLAYWVPAMEECFGIKVINNHKFPNLKQWCQDLSNHSLVKEVLPNKDELVAYLRAIFGIN